MILKAIPYASEATYLARLHQDEFVTPEHIFAVMLECGVFNSVAEECLLDLDMVEADLEKYFEEISTNVGSANKFEAEASNALVYAIAEINKLSRYYGFTTDGMITEVLLNSDTEYLKYCFDKQGVSVEHFTELMHEVEKKEIESESTDNVFKRDLEGFMRMLGGTGIFLQGIPLINPENGNTQLENGMFGGIFPGNGIDSVNNPRDAQSNKRGSRGGKGEKPEISKYCIKLTDKAIDTFIGREDLIEKTFETLCRMKKNNVLHIGDPGVGKTALVYGLAKCIQDGNAPEDLKDAEVYKVDLSAMVAGSKFRGDFEERLKSLLNNALENDKIAILYFDEAHMLVGAGSNSEDGMDASNILKEYITTKSNLRVIGSTTYEEYSKTIAKNKALDRRFRCLFINETTTEETKEIVLGLVDEYSSYHDVRYTKEALIASVELTDKYVKDKKQPDKSIDIIDESGAYAKMNGIKDVDVDTIEIVLSKQYEIPRKEVMQDETEKLRNLAKSIENTVFGQKECIDAVVDKIQYYRAGMVPENNPIGSFIAVGPTGVGKTELAKAVAKEMNMHFLRFDMSEYSEKHSVSKLIGSPPGYVGHTNGGLLVSEVRKHPNCVLLLDEIEKADSSIFDVLLQVMDNAVLTDGTGEKADFRGVLIIMTSNAGATYDNKKKLGFDVGNSVDETSDNMSNALRDFFRPEFLARVDKILKFNSLDSDTAKKIAVKKLEDINFRVSRKGIKLKYSDSLIDYLSKVGVDRETGARGLQKKIDVEIGTKVKDEILFGEKTEGERTISLDYSDSKVILK